LGWIDEGGAGRHRSRADVTAVAERLRAHVEQGGHVAASCSAVFLLEFAGLLNGRRATTAWWLAPALQRLNPHCTVDADRMVCRDGPIITAGAAFAQADLMLVLLRQACGAELVERLSRLLLLDARHAQSKYVIPEVLARGDQLLARLVARIDSALPTCPAVSELAQAIGVSERTLNRHVQRAAGCTTRSLIQSVRLRRARSLLEQSGMSVEQVAAAVGYEDSTALRRLMRKAIGASPRQLRSVSLGA
jgi:transcriptional regulator GlxA family with amidase domain